MGRKKLKDEISLEGKIETITAMELRTCPGEILTEVDCGKTYLITRNKKITAVLSKPPGVNLTIDVNEKGDINYKL